MTKKTKNLVIAAGLIGLAGSIGAIAGLSPTLAGGRTLAPGHANGDAATALGITADIDSRIAVDVANQALPGEIVDVELTYDHDLITINDLLELLVGDLEGDEEPKNAAKQGDITPDEKT